MPVSSLIVSTEPFLTKDVAENIGAIKGATVTDETEKGLIVITDTSRIKQDKDIYKTIEGLRGVRKVDLIYSNFEDDAEEAR